MNFFAFFVLHFSFDYFIFISFDLCIANTRYTIQLLVQRMRTANTQKCDHVSFASVGIKWIMCMVWWARVRLVFAIIRCLVQFDQFSLYKNCSQPTRQRRAHVDFATPTVAAAQTKTKNSKSYVSCRNNNRIVIIFAPIETRYCTLCGARRREFIVVFLLLFAFLQQNIAFFYSSVLCRKVSSNGEDEFLHDSIRFFVF